MLYTKRLGKRGGGVVIYVRQDLKFVQRNEFCTTISNVYDYQ